MSEEAASFASTLSAGSGRLALISGLPTLRLPRNSWNGGFVKSKLVNKTTKKISVMLPEVDPIISEYGNLYLRIRYTIRMTEFTNQKYLLYQLINPAQRLAYALAVSKRLNGYSLLETDRNEAETRETLTFYLDNQSFLISEAMFLAQVLHEMGIKSDLNEGGINSKKSYGGKIYPYFFFMYDKESPAPNRRKVALNLGNDQPGDGTAYHGRGYIQLTGKTNYRNAGAYLNLDLVNSPDLANDPKNSVRIAAWFWRFGNGNLNNFTDKDSEANFQTVTERINGGLTNYAERQTLYKNAKKLFGVK